MRRRGFTFIDLLVAIAIVAVVAAVLLPVMASAKARTNKSSCLSNLHNVAVAAQLYSADSHDSLLPMVAGGLTYDQLLEPYNLIKNVWTCPTAAPENRDRTRSIGPNRALAVSFDEGHEAGPISNSVLESPAQTINFVDDAATWPGSQATPERAPHVTWACDIAYRNRKGLPIEADQEQALLRHGGWGNFGFADGSARSLEPTRTVFPKVLWFVKHPDADSFTMQQELDEGDCDRIGMLGYPAGRDPVTKS